MAEMKLPAEQVRMFAIEYASKMVPGVPGRSADERTSDLLAAAARIEAYVSAPGGQPAAVPSAT